MNRQQIASFACRILAIYAMIRAFSFAQTASAQIGTSMLNSVPNNTFFVISSILPLLFIIIFAVLLWVLADSIGDLMMPEEHQDERSEIINISKEDIQAVGFSIIGLFVLVQVIPELTAGILNYSLIEKKQPFNETMNVYTKIRLIVSSIQFIIGLFLLFGSRGLVGAIKKARKAGPKDIDC